MAQTCHAVFRERAWLCVTDAHEVLLFGTGLVAHQQLGDAPVLGEDQQAGGVDIEPAGRGQVAQMAGVEVDARGVARPAVRRLDEHHGRLVAVLGLAAHQAHGLVQQHRHQAGLGGAGAGVDVDDGVGRDALAKHHGAAAYAHVAGLYPFIGLAA